jgi:hypothetical protein
MADEVNRMKQDLRRLVFDEQVRGEKKNKAGRLSYRKTKSGGEWLTVTQDLEPHRDYTTIFTLRELAQDTEYDCKLAYSAGEAKGVIAGTFRTAPKDPRDLTFLLASCNYANLKIFTSGNVQRAWMTIQALAKSRNAATIRVLSEIGLAPVRDMAKALGISSEMEMNLGLALGNSEVTLAELVRAYTAFATGGKVIDPIFVLEVRDRTGKVLAENVHLLADHNAGATPPVGQGGEETSGPAESDLDKVMKKLRDEASTNR